LIFFLKKKDSYSEFVEQEEIYEEQTLNDDNEVGSSMDEEEGIFKCIFFKKN
jgi:hypothetical protein